MNHTHPFRWLVLAVAAAGLAPVVPANAQSPSGLMGLWHFDGNADDASGHGHHGIVVGATPVPDGVAGAGYAFDGASRISVAGLDFSNGRYTVNLWLRTSRPAVTEDWRTAINKADTAAGNQTFEVLLGDGRPPPTEGANAPMMQVWRGAASVVNESVGFNSNINARDGQWHMATMTYETGEQRLYIDGCLAGTSNFRGPLPQVPQDVTIGGVEGFGPYHHPWIGSLDEVSIYARTLAANEVSKLYRLHRSGGGGCGAIGAEAALTGAVCRNRTASTEAAATISRQFWNCASLSVNDGDQVSTEVSATAK